MDKEALTTSVVLCCEEMSFSSDVVSIICLVMSVVEGQVDLVPKQQLGHQIVKILWTKLSKDILDSLVRLSLVGTMTFRV